MSRRKTTETQKAFYNYLPAGLPKLSVGAKVMLGWIIYSYGTDFAAENGYIFKSNLELAGEIGYDESYIKKLARELVVKGLITTKRGNRTKEGVFASEYYLSEDMKQKINYIQKIKDMSELNPNKGELNLCMGELTKNIEDLTLIINELKGELNELKNEVKTLKSKNLFPPEPDIDVTNYCSYTSILDKAFLASDENDNSNLNCNDRNSDDNSFNEMVSDARKDFNLEKQNFITEIFRQLNYNIDQLYKAKEEILISHYNNQLSEIFNKAKEKKDWFNQKQWKKLDLILDGYLRLTEAKDKYLNHVRIKKETNDTVSDIEHDSEGSRQDDFKYFTKEELAEYVLDTCEKFENYDQWDRNVTKVFEEKYGKRCFMGGDDDATKIFVKMTSWANKYYLKTKNLATGVASESV